MNTAKIREIVTRNMEREAEMIHLHDTVAGVLRAKWDGKKLNKRLEADITKALSNGKLFAGTVRFMRNYGMFQVEVNDCNMLLGYDSRPTNPRLAGTFSEAYDPASFEEADICHGAAAKERNEQRQALLHDPGRIQQIATTISQAQAALESLKNAREYLGELTKYGSIGAADRYDFEALIPDTK